MKHLVTTLLLAFLLIGSVSADHLPDGPSPNNAHKDIVEVATAAGTFKTLVAALSAADLVDVLKGDGPFTVFAPSDDAFANLPAGTIDMLLQPENKQTLVSILTLHVVSGEIRSSDLLSVPSAETVNGARLPIGLRVKNANVISADIEASNGIIHVIDAVLLPADLRLDMATMPAIRIIEESINKGAPMYNSGNIAGTDALYRETMTRLMDHPDVSHHARSAMRRAMEKVNHTHSADDRAWMMRDALDMVYASLHR